MMIDIDDFKSVNDTFGHTSGDVLLKDLSAKISSLLRKSDMVCRVGGDEFFALLMDIPDESVVSKKAEQLCSLQFNPGNGEYNVTVSIGIVMIPADGNDFETLYKKADIALYKQKELGKNGYLFFNSISEDDSLN